MASDAGFAPIRVVCVSPHPVVRLGLRCACERSDDVDVCGDASLVDELRPRLKDLRPDVVLLHVDEGEILWQEVGSLTATLDARLLVMTASTDPSLHRLAIQQGASGIVLTSEAPDVIVRAIEKIHAGQVWLDRAQTANVLDEIRGRGRSPESIRIESLTRRERQIVSLVGEGLKNGPIAERLFISHATVRNHLTSILGKLELTDRFELAVFAFRHGLVRPTSPQPASALVSAAQTSR